jgi:YbbR domain-containing protein
MKKKVITLILISIFSIVLWISISLSDEYRTSITLPVEFVELPEDYSINTSQMNEVSISLKGEGWSLAGLSFVRDLKFYIKPEDTFGKQVISSRNAVEQNAWLPSNIQVLEVEPAIIEYVVEKVKRKIVPVRSVIKIDYKPGYGIVSNITLYPDSVEIYGPESRIDDIEFVNTELTSFPGIDKKVSEIVNLEKIQSINFSSNSTRMEFDVQKIVDKTFEEILVETINVPPSKSIELFPRKIKLVLRGGINELSKLTNEDFNPYVTFSQALNDTLGAIVPFIEVPEFTRIIEIKPGKLDYIIKQY